MNDIKPEFKFAVVDGLDNTFLPEKGSSNAAGWDVKIAEDVELKYGETKLISLGIRCFCPPGYWLEVRPRSSSFLKKNLSFLYGVVDEDYEGIIKVAAQYTPFIDFENADEVLYINYGNSMYKFANKIIQFFSLFVKNNSLKLTKGEKIAQLIPHKVNQISVEGISNKEYAKLCQERGMARGEGGFGSTTEKK